MNHAQYCAQIKLDELVKMCPDRIYRIGEKTISLTKATNCVEKALGLRESGLSQSETARKLELDRSFVSRLESIGEIRKGNRIAVIGFPLKNYDDLKHICHTRGLDFNLILNNEQRWEMVSNKEALNFFNQMLDLLSKLRSYETLILITSKKWHQLAEALLDIQIIHVNLGETPINEDVVIEEKKFLDILDHVVLEDKGEVIT